MTTRSGRICADLAQHRGQVGLGGEVERLGHRLDPLGPDPHLGRGLLAADVEHGLPLARGAGGDVEQQGGLADARLAGDEHDGAGHEAAAEDAVELADPGAAGLGAARVDVADRDGGTVHHHGRGGADRDRADLADRPPGVALAAPADPLDRRPAALGAAVAPGLALGRPRCLRCHGRQPTRAHRQAAVGPPLRGRCATTG